MKCGILCYAADNLEASLVGGYSACFSSKDVCRVCHIQYEDLESHIHDFDERPHKYWSVAEYDQIIKTLDDEVEEGNMSWDEDVEAGNLFTVSDQQLDVVDVESNSDNADSDRDDASDTDGEAEDLNKRGIKSVCPLNVLDSFHSVHGFPPDILHDVFEGIIPSDLLGIIRILSVNGGFSLSQYNDALYRLGFHSYESNDKPCPVPTSSKFRKLKGKAVSHWTHLRNWPLIIKKFISNFNDPALNLGLLLHEIVERLCAQEFFLYEIGILEEKIVEYLELRKNVRKDYPNLMPNPKPKHHFLRKESHLHIIIYLGACAIILLPVFISIVPAT